MPRVDVLLSVLACVLGIALRLANYVRCPSLWLDETKLALNIPTRGYLDLMRPLDFEQVASVPFLWITKLATQLGGVNEWMLRFAPTVGGIALIFVFARLAARVLSPWVAGVATILVACSPLLVHFANEFKPYSLDSLFAAWLVLEGWSCVSSKGVPRRNDLARLGIVGCVSILCSLPAVFVAAGVLAALSTTRLRLSRTGWLSIGLLAGAWGLCWALFYFLTYRSMASNATMLKFWDYAFLHGPEAGEKALYAVQTLLGGFLKGNGSVVVGLPFWSACFLVVLGSVGTYRRGGVPLVCLLLLPILACFAASVLGLYAAAVRLLLFLVPQVTLLLAQGMELLCAWLPARAKGVAVVSIASVFLLRMFPLDWSALTAPRSVGFRERVKELKSVVRPGDAIYVNPRGAVSWLYYTTDWTAPDWSRLAWFRDIAKAGGVAFENADSRGRDVGPNEGDGLVREGPLGRELYGLPPGIQWRWGKGLLKTRPDGNFFRHEVGRISAFRRIWLVFDHDLEHLEGSLFGHLSEAGYQRLAVGPATFRAMERF